MPSVKSVIANEPLRVVAITVGYVALGTPLANPIRMLKIYNASTGDAFVSFDGGATDHEIIPSTGFLLLDLSSNRVWDAELVMKKATQVSVRGAGAGNVYMSTYYAT
jgi:hypothetical protein